MAVESHMPRRATIDWAFRGIVVALIAFQLFVPPVLSVADNNDFQKLAGRRCLGHFPQPVLFDYTDMHWRFSPKSCVAWTFRSSAEIPLTLAMGLNRIFTSPVVFDLRWMGVIYSVFFLAGFVWLQHALHKVSLPASVAAQAGFVLVACNAVYIPNFSTFSFDTATLVALLPSLVGVALLLLRTEAPAATLLLTAAALTMLSLSKGQHSFIALLCLPAFWLRRDRKRFPPIWARAFATAAVIAGAWIVIRSVPDGYAGQATFSALFYRILPGVSDPAAYLSETRIPRSYIAFIGEHAFSPGVPISDPDEQRRFTRWFGPSDLAVFFLRHPNIAWRMLTIHLDEGSLDRVRMNTGSLAHRLGNYEESTGKPPQTLSHFFCFWPYLKERLFGGHARRYLLYIVAVVASAWVLRPRVPGMRILLAIVTGMLAASLAVVMVDGVDSGRHLLIFNFLLDLTAAAAAAFAIERWTTLPASTNRPDRQGAVFPVQTKARHSPLSKFGRVRMRRKHARDDGRETRSVQRPHPARVPAKSRVQVSAKSPR